VDDKAQRIVAAAKKLVDAHEAFRRLSEWRAGGALDIKDEISAVHLEWTHGSACVGYGDLRKGIEEIVRKNWKGFRDAVIAQADTETRCARAEMLAAIQEFHGGEKGADGGNY
jgi:hypothetical protein